MTLNADGSGTIDHLTPPSSTDSYAGADWSQGLNKVFASVSAGGGGTRIAALRVDHPVSATAMPLQGTVGERLTRQLAEITDGDVSSVPEDLAVSIDWGDGVSSPGTVS